MKKSGGYREYAHDALANYLKRDGESRKQFYNAVKDLKLESVLDVGCGAGQELFPFLENTGARCIGIDTGEELGAVTGEVFPEKGFSERVSFVRASGDFIPFENESFDAVLCLVALPYMNNRRTIAEIARVLKKGGLLILKIHAPRFYFSMIGNRLKTFNLKLTAYPLICIAGSLYHHLSGKQLEKGFWKGKEVYQTRGFIRRVCAENGLRIIGETERGNLLSPTFLIEKWEIKTQTI